MRKIIIIAISLLLIGFVGNNICANDKVNISFEEIPIKISGVKQEIDTVNVDNRVYVSVRDFCNAVGMDINWNNNDRTIDIAKTVEELKNKDLGVPFPEYINKDTAVKFANALFEQYINSEELSNYEMAVTEIENGKYYKISRYPKNAFGGQFSVIIRKADGKIMGGGLGSWLN